MNKEETKKAIDIMQAFVDGGKIISSANGEVTSPAWDWLCKKYSVKPESIERWVLVKDGHVIQINYESKDAAEAARCITSAEYKAVLLREPVE